MLSITLLFALLISLAALAYVVLPLVRQQSPLLPVEDERLTDLLSRKDTALRAIKALEFDHQMGKMSEEDFLRFNQRLRRQAIVLIQQIEKIRPESALLDEQVEAAIARARQQRNASSLATGEATPVPPSLVGATAATPPARFCTQCGTQLDASHKFCSNCGTPVAGSAAVKA
ncbi:MAG: zinc-ribbon domain-containing protein [Caldilineaceae bacterium]|nr:zinc-ribbon domain-containing protein [Caldilineaceae bacterium]